MAENKSIVKPDTDGVKALLGNPKKAIIKLALPMIVAMSVQTIYNVVDALWVSGLGADALSAIGFFFPFFFMIMALATGLGVGGGSAVSRKIGARDKAGADNVAAHTIVLMFFLSIIISVPFFIFAPAIFSKLGAGKIAPVAASYARIIFGGAIIIFFSNVAGALLRGEGNVKRTMYAMMGGAGLNIVLDPLFIYTLKLGVAGAAWATVISLFISASILFYWICIKQDTYLSITLKGFRFDKEIVKDILNVGLPSALLQLTMSFSVLLLNTIVVKVGGTDGIAVFTTGWRVATFASLPLLGMATAVTSVTGAAYGGHEFKKLDTAYLYAIRIGLIIELFVAALTYIFAPQIVALFTMSKNAARIANDLIIFLRIMCIYYPTTAFGIISSAMFQGTGKGINSLIITIFRTIILVAPLAFIFSIVLNLKLTGVWWGIVIGNISGGIFAFFWARIYIKYLLAQPN
ncbi:MAG: MATE family efflux transporter [candidate division WOR-3 bacterium]|nr:MATE family efflux transporter [candidate division WOR-3 bacterium]